MNRKHSPARNRAPQPIAPPASREEEWVFEAMRHLFAEVTAAKRG